jgi:Gas vesicle synthesis protein GvpL/GvpF
VAPDAIPDPVRDGLSVLARADVDALIAEARAEARADVKALLRDAYSKALLAEAGASFGVREPRPPAARETADGLWVYCIVPAERELPGGLSGISERGAPRLVGAAGVAALVSPVPLSEFGEEALRENLNDLAWLERMVRAHEAVLDGMLADGTLVPMRVCTIYRGEEQVRAMLEDRAPLFRDELRRLEGRAEWGVKIYADRERLDGHVRTQSDQARRLAGEVADGPEGGAYLARKKLDALVRDEADAMLTEVVREAHARMEEWASASVVLPGQNRELSGHDGEMVFNGAYLVEHDRVEAVAGLLSGLDSQYRPCGLAFELTGPWPPYNFAGDAAWADARR